MYFNIDLQNKKNFKPQGDNERTLPAIQHDLQQVMVLN